MKLRVQSVTTHPRYIDASSSGYDIAVYKVRLDSRIVEKIKYERAVEKNICMNEELINSQLIDLFVPAIQSFHCKPKKSF